MEDTAYGDKDVMAIVAVGLGFCRSAASSRYLIRKAFFTAITLHRCTGATSGEETAMLFN